MAKDFWPELHSDPFARERLKRSCELLQCTGNHSILDVGCHRMEALDFLPRHCDYKGIDILFGDEFDGGLKEVYCYDRILCLEVLEHLKYPQKTLESIASLLKEDGICVISLPNEASLFHRIRCLFGIVDQECFFETGKHLHLPSLKQAFQFVSKYLKVQKVEYYVSRGAGTRTPFLPTILKLIPPSILRILASLSPSLFARGFIFVCSKK